MLRYNPDGMDSNVKSQERTERTLLMMKDPDEFNAPLRTAIDRNVERSPEGGAKP